LTVNSALPPTSLVVNPDSGLTVKPATSSLVIVVVAVAVVIVGVRPGPVGLERVTAMVSSGSTRASPNTSRVMVLDVSPAPKLIVPVTAVAPEVPPMLL
jgi:hypothetical protein